jgi:hypothetical protein
MQKLDWDLGSTTVTHQENLKTGMDLTMWTRDFDDDSIVVTPGMARQLMAI